MRKKTLFLFLVTFALVAQAALLPDLEAQSWTPRKAITNLLGNSLGPRAAAVGDTIYLVFSHRQGAGNLQIYLMKSSDAGVTFSTPVQLTSDSWDHRFPVVAATTGGMVYIAWQDQRDGSNPETVGDIFFIRSTDGAATFGTPVRITPADSHPSRVPSLYADGSKVYLSWFDMDTSIGSGAIGIFFRKSLDSGASWGTTTIVTTRDGEVDSELPRLLKDTAGTLHILFRSSRNGDPQGGFPPYEIFHYKSFDDGSTWLSPAQPVSPGLPLDIANTWGADLGMSGNGVLHAAWWEESNGMNVFYRRSPDGGMTWGPLVKLSSYNFSMKEPNPQASGGLQGDVSIITDGTNAVYVAWHGFTKVASTNVSFGKIQVRKSSDNGLNFGTIEDLDTAESGSNIDMVRTSTKLHMFYEGHDSGSPDEIEYRYYSTINNQAPNGTITAPTSDLLKIKPNVTYTFKGSGTDADGTVASYQWNWGGAKANDSTGAGTNSTVMTSFPTYGDFTVRFIPIDNNLEPDPTPDSFLLRVADISDNAFFVRQLYLDFLNRTPEPGGFAYWVGALNDGTVTRAQVAFEFFKSFEFQDNGAYIGRLYMGIMFRRAEFGGWLYWLDELNNGRRTKLEILAAFIASPEFQSRFGDSLSNREFVRLLFVNILGREPDQAGSDFWTAKLDLGEMTRAEVAWNFVESPEFISKTENSLFIQLEYFGLLRREAETTGHDYWLAEFNSGRSKYDLTGLFLGSEEYRLRFED